jgi:membrane protein
MAKEPGERATKRQKTAPHPDDPRKPDELNEITKQSWLYVLRKTAREFSADQATDLAAALTYYGVLAVFPALLAFVSLVGLFGDAADTTDALLELMGGLVPAATLEAIREPIQNLAASPAAGITFVTGVIGALWSASGYVGAFSRAMNRIYSIQEGRPFWKLRPVTLAVTVLAVAAAVLAAVLITVTGPIATEIGELLGIGETAVIVWNIVRWPVLAFLAVLIVAVLYYATPNVQQPKFRWMSLGALLALVAWVVASAGFAFYASNFASYNETYGSIGGIIVFLLWVWISNIALLFGAELDAELERGRELQAGIEAEETIQLPPRDTRQSDKAAKQHEKDVAAGRALRARATGNPQTEEPASSPEDEAGGPPAENKKMKKAMKALNRTNKLQAAQFIVPKSKK